MKHPWIIAAAFEPIGARIILAGDTRHGAQSTESDGRDIQDHMLGDLMLKKPSRPQVEGGMVEITLEFQHAGKVTSPFTIAPKGAKSMDHTGHGS